MGLLAQATALQFAHHQTARSLVLVSLWYPLLHLEWPRTAKTRQT